MHKLKLGRIASKDRFKDAGELYYFLFEVIINFVFLPPSIEDVLRLEGSIYINYDLSKLINIENFNLLSSEQNKINNSEPVIVELYYSISNVLTILIMFRIYHYIRVIHTYSYWATPKADSICKLMNTNASISFGIKAYLKINPFLTLLIGILFIIFSFGISIRLFEYYNYQIMQLIDTSDNGHNSGMAIVMLKFQNMLNSFWLILVTMTTSNIN